jgi:hypothetical protein
VTAALQVIADPSLPKAGRKRHCISVVVAEAAIVVVVAAEVAASENATSASLNWHEYHTHSAFPSDACESLQAPAEGQMLQAGYRSGSLAFYQFPDRRHNFEIMSEPVSARKKPLTLIVAGK